MEQEAFSLIAPSAAYSRQIAAYRQEFLSRGDSMDGCGSLRKFEDPLANIGQCRLRSDPLTAGEAGGHAAQFLLIRASDDRVIGMAQYRFDADPRFRIGYSIRPGERRKGYGKLLLRQLMCWLGAQGIAEAVIACEPSNSGSRRIILSCGGEFMEQCEYRGIKLLVYKLRTIPPAV